MRLLVVAIQVSSFAISEVLLVGSGSPNGLLLAKWDTDTNTSTRLGSPIGGRIPNPSNAAAPVVTDGEGGFVWTIAALTADDLSAVLTTQPLNGSAATIESMSGGEDARCFILYATPTDGSSTLHCLSEVDSGTLSTTELRSVDRSSGKTAVVSSGRLPCFSPLGPAVYDNERGVIVALYIYSPCLHGVRGVAQGSYLVTLNASTGVEQARVPVPADTRSSSSRMTRVARRYSRWRRSVKALLCSSGRSIAHPQRLPPPASVPQPCGSLFNLCRQHCSDPAAFGGTRGGSILCCDDRVEVRGGWSTRYYPMACGCELDNGCSSLRVTVGWPHDFLAVGLDVCSEPRGVIIV